MSASKLLVDLLTVGLQADGVFVAPAVGERHVRAFGGRTYAQALMAAIASVDTDRRVHSAHAYFLRPGDSSAPVECVVHTVRDGRSFSVRRVEARQHGKTILELTASFHTGEAGPEHVDAMPVVPPADSLAPFEQRFAGRAGEDDMARWFYRAAPFDLRYVHVSPFEERQAGHPAHQLLWLRARDLPNDPAIHVGAFAYASDMTILDAVLLRHGMLWTDRAMLGATLDHTIWFHRPVDFDQWLLLDQSASVATDGRALATAKVWQADGQLVATIAQEALMRPMVTVDDIP